MQKLREVERNGGSGAMPHKKQSCSRPMQKLREVERNGGSGATPEKKQSCSGR